MSERGIGASVLRTEDARFLHGLGEYVGDIALPRTLNAAFLRSPVAHARIRSVEIPDAIRDRVFVAADLADVKPIRAIASLAGYKASDYPVLATDKVRFVGEPVAVAVAPDRGEAEDLIERVAFDYEALPAAVESLEARESGAPLVHEHWGDNIVHSGVFQAGEIDRIAGEAAHAVTRSFKIGRQAHMPMESRAALAHYDTRLDEIVVYNSNQMPHLIQSGLAQVLGIEQRKIRVVSPDVGGGFGLKIYVEPECVVAAWLARKLGRPVRWIEDNFEHLTADANCREHRYTITAHTDAAGRILGVEFDVTVDAGAYSIWPWTSAVEAAQAAGILTSAYDFRHFRATVSTVATNKPPIVVYRGVARPGVCFSEELLIDAIARAVGREPHEVRIDNMVRPEQMPYTTVTNKIYDSGDYPTCIRKAAEMIDVPAVRARQERGEDDGRLIGVGFACYTEQTAHGTSVLSKWGVELVPGFEPARARLTPDGELVLEVAIHSHGQGMQTTLAQIANEVLGLDPTRVSVRFGDTSVSPYGTGTYASRSIVMAGGAVAVASRSLAERIGHIGAHLLQCDRSEVRVEAAEVRGPGGSVDFRTVARAWYAHPEELPPDIDREGLTVTSGYRPEPDSGVFSYATHAAVVALDPELGSVEILDYVVVEDCGQAVNPMVVDGQVIGGTVQGIGTALYEEAVFDAGGQPLNGTLADYQIPGATEVPDIRLAHMSTPSPWTEFGIKGMGEGGAIAPPAAIGNAVNDALAPLGVELTQSPMTPRRIVAALEEAGR